MLENMNLKSMLSKRSQTQMNTYRTVPFILTSRTSQVIFYGRNLGGKTEMKDKGSNTNPLGGRKRVCCNGKRVYEGLLCMT